MSTEGTTELPTNIQRKIFKFSRGMKHKRASLAFPCMMDVDVWVLIEFPFSVLSARIHFATPIALNKKFESKRFDNIEL